VVFVPHHADTEKLGKIRDLGAKVRVHGDDCVDTEAHARAWANENGQTYISPYNDSDVIAGQGTVAFELLSQVDKLDAVFVSVGGGGLISGIGAYLKARCPEVEIVACSPIQSPAMHACLEAGRIIEVPCGDTLSDATAGGVEPGAITFPLCQRVIDRSVLVDEAGIAAAMRRVHTELSLRIEGAAGVAVAAWEAEAAVYRDRRVGIIICGGNISDGAFKRLIGKDPPSTIESG
jgi:threonine dehydratase